MYFINATKDSPWPKEFTIPCINQDIPDGCGLTQLPENNDNKEIILFNTVDSNHSLTAPLSLHIGVPM